MPFQIHAMDPAPFALLFEMSEDELRTHGARRQIVRSKPGTPCRVSLADAEIGETVILVHHEHQTGDSPYRASHAIFVRRDVERAYPKPGEVPEVLRSRLVSLRAFDAEHMMIAADVLEGDGLPDVLCATFEDDAVAYVHLHNAKPGCFAAAVTRA
jgi:hypothetical protein